MIGRSLDAWLRIGKAGVEGRPSNSTELISVGIIGGIPWINSRFLLRCRELLQLLLCRHALGKSWHDLVHAQFFEHVKRMTACRSKKLIVGKEHTTTDSRDRVCQRRRRIRQHEDAKNETE